MADERAEMACLLEDESMRRLYEEVGDDEYLIGEFRRYAGWEPVRRYRKFRKNMRRQSIRKNLIRLSVAASLDRKSTRLNSSHVKRSRMPSSA